MMKIVRALSIFLLVASLISVVVAYVVVRNARDRAVWAQIIQVSEADALMGEKGTNIGSPKKLIIDDPNAFLPGEGDGGVKLVSQNYLDAHKQYPLQLQTIDVVGAMVQLGGLLSACLFAGVAVFAKRRLDRQ